jgi:hypothetical protein
MINKMDKSITFVLQATLHNDMDRKSGKNAFQRTFHVKYLKEVGRNATFYDPELKMHFENPNALAEIYEIETDDVRVNFPNFLGKASDFVRRVNYRYDWIQIRINAKGKVLAVENREELKASWKRIRVGLQNDYEGKAVAKFLKEIDTQTDSNNPVWSAVYNYFYFGLLFPHIPCKHVSQWENKRLIEFSEYEEEKFEEHTVYNKTEDGIRYYDMKYEALPGSKTIIDECEGYLLIQEDDIFPVETDIEIKFHIEDIANQWHFCMYQL